jgi:hypothetical protein
MKLLTFPLHFGCVKSVCVVTRREGDYAEQHWCGARKQEQGTRLLWHGPTSRERSEGLGCGERGRGDGDRLLERGSAGYESSRAIQRHRTSDNSNGLLRVVGRIESPEAKSNGRVRFILG